jgi:hypothetical protein
MESSLRGAQRRNNPENVGALRSPGLLRFARNDDCGSIQMQLAQKPGGEIAAKAETRNQSRNNSAELPVILAQMGDSQSV